MLSFSDMSADTMSWFSDSRQDSVLQVHLECWSEPCLCALIEGVCLLPRLEVRIISSTTEMSALCAFACRISNAAFFFSMEKYEWSAQCFSVILAQVPTRRPRAPPAVALVRIGMEHGRWQSRATLADNPE